MAYQHPALRSKLFPENASVISKAVADAREPDLTKRDSRPLYAILAAMPKADPDIIADMETRKGAVLGYDYTIAAAVPPGETSAPEVELQRAGEIYGRWLSSRLHGMPNVLLNGLFYGDQLIELDWGINEFGSNAVLAWRPVETIDVRLYPAAVTGLARMVYESPSSDKYTIRPYDIPAQIVRASFNPLLGVDNTHQGGLFSSILWYTYLKFLNWYGWARAGERMGVVQHNRSYANQDSVNTAYTFLQQFVDHVAVLPDDIKLLVKEVLGEPPGYQSFEKFIDKVSSKSQRLILGQDVVETSHATGSYAQAKEASSATKNRGWSDIAWLQDIITEQYVRVDYTLNYGTPSTGLYPRFQFLTDEQEDFKANASIISQLASAGWRATDQAEVSRKVGITVEPSVPPAQII